MATFFQDYRRLLDAKLAAIQAEEAKELVSAQITEEQKATIRKRFAAQAIAAESEYQRQIADQATARLSVSSKIVDAEFNLQKARYDQEFVLFRDTEGLRAAKLRALEAAYQVEISRHQLTAEEKLAIDKNYEAQRTGVAQQFPTFFQQQMQLIQQSAVFT